MRRKSFLAAVGGFLLWPAEAIAMNIQIAIPGDGSALRGVVPVTVSASPQRNLDRVELYIDGVLHSTDDSEPYEFSWDTTSSADGKHALTARAFYKQRFSEASIVVWTANGSTQEPPPPTAPPSIPTGLAAAVVEGNRVQLDWNDNPTADAVDSYQVYLDDANLDLNVPQSSYLSAALAGAHEFRVSAHNVKGYGDWTAPVAVTVGSEPPPIDYTYRFATFDPSTDKVTGCLNRFPPTYSWWVPGTAEGSPWPKGGGIFPVSHAQHGPGLNLLLTDEMLYGNVSAGTGPKDSNVVRYVMEPHLVDERLRVPAAGSIHTWECTIMRPFGTWPNGFYECVWEQGTDNGYGANVGHHIFLNNNGRFPGWSYYFGRQNGSGPLGGTYWQFYNAPVPFNAGEYHTIRWEFKWTAPGVADGYLKTWIGVDGGAMQPWLDLQNIATQVSGFKQHYTQMVTIRTPRNVLTHPNLSLHVHNMRVKIA